MAEWRYQEKPPPNIRKGYSSHLQIDEIGEGNGGHYECNALGSQVVGEDLGIEDYAGPVDAGPVDSLEEVTTSRVSNTKNIY